MSRDVLIVLPPDFTAPKKHVAMRFPPLGPAVVAAAVAPLGLRLRAVDLVMEHEADPFRSDAGALDDPERVERHLRGGRDDALEALVDEIVLRIERIGGREPLVAISVDRGSQTLLAALLGRELGRRWGARIVVGGVAIANLRALLERTGARGGDVVTTASTPAQIVRAFETLLAVTPGRDGPPIESNDELVTLVRGGMRKAPSADGWPLPDFSIYDLDRYRRDLLAAEARADGTVRPPLGASLVLPYFFTFECQFSCAFCQTGGTQEAKAADAVVRELAELSERWSCGEFLFFDTQINLHAEALSRALLAAKLDLRWSDSFRVRPTTPGLLELMAEAGCASVTIGVESASERVLKAMVKGHRPEHATETIREAHEAEMMVRVNLLTCYPGETREELEETLAWTEANADRIDDLAPSSFYLTADSPIGRRPERHGIVLRGARTLRGPTRFRKSPDSLEYDEVGGMRWEEREAMLHESEERALAAWRRGREGKGMVGGLSPSTMLALRRRFPTKAEIHRFLDPPAPHRAPPEAPAPAPALEAPPRPLRPALLGRASPELHRVLAVAFHEVEPSLRERLRPGAVAHALLWRDGSSLFFRGSVARDESHRPASIAIDEHLSALDGPAANDGRREAVREGATVARGGAALGPALVLTFRVDAVEGAPS